MRFNFHHLQPNYKVEARIINGPDDLRTRKQALEAVQQYINQRQPRTPTKEQITETTEWVLDITPDTEGGLSLAAITINPMRRPTNFQINQMLHLAAIAATNALHAQIAKDHLN